MATQQEFDALINSPSFQKKLKAVQALAAQQSRPSKVSPAAKKKFNLCDNYYKIKPYLQLVLPLLGLIDKNISKEVQKYIAAADAGCATTTQK